jgi:hypothetical protein
MLKQIVRELRHHSPFTLLGAVTGVLIMLLFIYVRLPEGLPYKVFYTLHPFHVLLSALATAGMYRLHGKRKLLPTILIGYVGSVGIGTLSDCIIPYLGEMLLELPHRHAHIGFIEMWWLVNPLALLGIGIAILRPNTVFPHAGHVLLSTWASLFHMIMAMQQGQSPGMATLVVIPVFLFLAVWVPCCTSDIVFPLLFAEKGQ